MRTHEFVTAQRASLQEMHPDTPGRDAAIERLTAELESLAPVVAVPSEDVSRLRLEHSRLHDEHNRVKDDHAGLLVTHEATKATVETLRLELSEAHQRVNELQQAASAKVLSTAPKKAVASARRRR